MVTRLSQSKKLHQGIHFYLLIRGTHGDPILHVLAVGHNEQPQMGRNFFNIYVIKSNVGKSESISLTYHSSLAVEDNDRIPQQIWVYKIA